MICPYYKETVTDPMVKSIHKSYKDPKHLFHSNYGLKKSHVTKEEGRDTCRDTKRGGHDTGRETSLELGS